MAPFQMILGMGFSGCPMRPTQQSGHSVDEVGAALDVDPAIDDGAAAACRARRRRGVDKAAPGGSLNGARFLARCGGRDAGGVVSPTAAVPARVATGGRAPLVDAGTRRDRLGSRTRRSVPARWRRWSSSFVYSRGGASFAAPDAMDLQIDTSVRRADSRRDRRAPGPDVARVRQPVVRPLPRRPAADRERARGASRQFATSRSRTAAASRSAARTASSSGRRSSSSPTAAKPPASSGRAKRRPSTRRSTLIAPVA